MINPNVWQRYFYWEIWKNTIFLLACFYGLYVIIDYATHHHHFSSQWKIWALYYGANFSSQLGILLPFALLVASIRTLSTLNLHNELIALMSSGVSKFSLMKPFLTSGLLGVVILYTNSEFGLPSALHKINYLHEHRAGKKYKPHRAHITAHHVILQDGSTVIYQNYNLEDHLLEDVFWVRNIDEIYRIGKLSLPANETDVVQGFNSERFLRNLDGDLVVAETEMVQPFPTMLLNHHKLMDTEEESKELSISKLWNSLSESQMQNSKEAQMTAALHQKIVLPWLALLAIIMPAPFCLRITRNLGLFLIYAGCLFALVALYLIIDSGVLLVERQAATPLWAIWMPFLFITVLCTGRFAIRTYRI